MPNNKKITDLPDDTTVTLADFVPIVTPGSSQTKKATLARVMALGGGSGGSGSSGSSVFLDSFVVNLPNNQTGIANGTTINAGDSIGPFLAAAFRKSSPAVYTGPSLSLSANNAPSVVEVGTSISITFAIGYTANDAGAETSRTMHKNGAVFNATGGAYTDTIVASTSPISYYATVNYAQGGINNDSLGGPDASGRIPAGLIDSGTLNYQGFYKIWYDAVSAAPASSAAARALSNVRFTTDGNNFTLNTGSSQTKFVLLLPPGKSLASVIDQDALNLDITAQYTASTISVNNAAGVAISYTLYTMSQSIPYSSNHRHNITIA